MTLSRWDTVDVNSDNENLYAFSDSDTDYRRAFWHPGVGMWQLDSAGLGAPLDAMHCIWSLSSAETAVEAIASNYCRSGADTPEGKRADAWWYTWFACRGDEEGDSVPNCEDWFQDHYDTDTGELSLPNRDGSVGHYGGMKLRFCRQVETGRIFHCWYVDPAQAEGVTTSWAYPEEGMPPGGPTPLTAPFYIYSQDGQEYRHWLKDHTGYDVGVYAWRPLGENARESLEWAEGEIICDLITGHGDCEPGVDVVLIVDSSGSMAWSDPFNKRLEAAKVYVLAASPADHVGVVDFDHTARLASPLVHIGDNRNNLKAAIETIDSSGSTNIGLGVQAGCNALIASASENITRAAILLTDGQQTVGVYNNEHMCFRERGWPIYTFGFGDADVALLQQIASNTGGEFRWLPTSNMVCEFMAVRAKIADIAPPPCITYHVYPGTSVQFNVSVPPDTGQATFATSWLGSDVVMTLTTPSGQVIDRDTPALNVIHDLSSGFETYTIIHPQPGSWEVRLFGADVPPEGEEVVFSFIALPGGGPPPCDELYPIALHVEMLTEAQVGDELMDVYNGAGSGDFGWLSWTGDPSALTLARSLTQPGDSDTYVNPADSDDHMLSVGDWVYGKPGVSNARSVRDALDMLKSIVITVPVWDAATEQGNHLRYHVVGFARIQITDYRLVDQNRISAIYWGPAACGD